VRFSAYTQYDSVLVPRFRSPVAQKNRFRCVETVLLLGWTAERYRTPCIGPSERSITCLSVCLGSSFGSYKAFRVEAPCQKRIRNSSLGRALVVEHRWTPAAYDTFPDTDRDLQATVHDVLVQRGCCWSLIMLNSAFFSSQSEFR
jgi:hypothetical protein